MRVLIDTNILLDVLLDRAPFVTDSSSIWAACDAGQLVGYISASALTDIFYIARRAVDLATARIAVGICLSAFEICPVDRQTLERATTLSGSDFGDHHKPGTEHELLVRSQVQANVQSELISGRMAKQRSRRLFSVVGRAPSI
jgi:hypothetical protein